MRRCQAVAVCAALEAVTSIPRWSQVRWSTRETLVEPLPKVPQTMGGRTFEWQRTQEKFGRGNDVTEALEETERSDAHRRKVSGWTPVVKTMSDQRLRVALVGRMNSGKSSLFNQLVHDPLVPKKHNAVKNFDGITRDSVEGHGALNDMSFTVIDTPGIVKGKIVEEALRAIATADVAVFVTAVDEDIGQDELNLIKFLHAKKLPAFMIVNKMDLVARDDEDRVLEEYHSLGLGTAVPMSVRRSVGLDSLASCLQPFYHIHAMRKVENDWDVEDLAMEGDEASLDEIRERNSSERFIRVAVVGRSNSGKSSLINRLVGYERNRTADELNTTRDATEIPCTYRGRKLKIIDTAGATRTRFRAEREFIGQMHAASIKEIRFAHICIVVFDATEGHPNKYDMALLHQIASEGRPFVLCANKWDAVLDPTATAEAIDFKIKRQVREVKYSNAVVVSAHNGMNLTLLLDHCLELYEKWNKRVRGHDLTKFWRRMEKSVIIPHHVARVGRLTQVNIRPPTFLLQLQTRNEQSELPKPLQEMMKNAIVEEFGFQGVPIRLIQEVKDSHPDYI
jgi:GTPase